MIAGRSFDRCPFAKGVGVLRLGPSTARELIGLFRPGDELGGETIPNGVGHVYEVYEVCLEETMLST